MFLRSLKSREGDDNEDKGEEERAGVILDKVDDVVADIADDIPSLMKMFKQWKGLTVEEELMTSGLANLSDKKFMEILNLYGLYSALGPKTFLAKLQRIEAKAHPGRV